MKFPAFFVQLIARILAIAILQCTVAFAATPPRTAAKKGIGLAERKGFGDVQLKALNVGWFYNWGSETALHTGVEFVPMIFSIKRITAPVKGEVVLGFNEPDNEKQSAIPVQDALAQWPHVASKARYVGSPAPAGNPLTSEWFAGFVKGHPKFDFIAVHWYKGADAKHLIRDLTEIHTKFNKPIWLTEFAPQTAGSSEKDPAKFSDAQVAAFITEATHFMESTPWVQRYAWHDSRLGTSALFDEKGELTATGRAYAAAGHPAK